MEIETTYDFIHAIQVYVTPKKFKTIKNALLTIPAKQRAAFWNIISAGYTTNSAFKNCQKLHKFVQNNYVEYGDAMNMIYNKNEVFTAQQNLKEFDLN